MAATTKKTSTVKKAATATAKKAVKSVASKVVEAATTTAATKVVAKTTKKTATATKKYVYVFFNCNDNKDATSMNIRYNNEAFADTVTGRKALLKKVEEEVAAGRVNMSDKEAVKNDILAGEPTDANGKLQYGDIERLVISA